MPVYEYQCKACGRDFEYQQRMSDPDKTTCETCGGARLKPEALAVKIATLNISQVTEFSRSGGQGRRQARWRRGGQDQRQGRRGPGGDRRQAVVVLGVEQQLERG